MTRPPRPRGESVVQRSMLRAWLFLGLISAGLQMAGFFYVLAKAGWSPGEAAGDGTAFHGAYLEATTMTFFSMVVCQIGTAFAARTDRASVRSVGMLTNPLLLWGIAFELALAAIFIYAPPFQSLLGTAALGPDAPLFAAPFPFIHELRVTTFVGGSGPPLAPRTLRAAPWRRDLAPMRRRSRRRRAGPGSARGCWRGRPSARGRRQSGA
jgi:magnesium-transporting ATPase (P-type)